MLCKCVSEEGGVNDLLHHEPRYWLCSTIASFVVLYTELSKLPFNILPQLHL